MFRLAARVVPVLVLLPLWCAAQDVSSCVILPTSWPASLKDVLPFSDGNQLKELITDRLRAANFCVPLELNRQSEAPRDVLYVWSAISRADKFLIKGPEYSGGQITQENFDVTAELRFVDIRTGEAFYSRAVTAQSIFKGVRPESAQVSQLFYSAAVKAVTTVTDAAIREYRPGVIEGRIVRTEGGKVYVDRGRPHSLGMGLLRVLDESGETAGTVRINQVMDFYSIGEVEWGNAPPGARIRTLGANLKIKSGPRYAVVVAPLPKELLSRNITAVEIADWSQTALGEVDSLALLAPVLSGSFFDQQEFVLTQTAGLNRDVLNQYAETPDGFAVVSVRSVSSGAIDIGVSARHLYRVGVFLQLIDRSTNEVQFSSFRHQTSEQITKKGIRDFGDDTSVYRDLLQAALKAIAGEMRSAGEVQSLRGHVVSGRDGLHVVRFQGNNGCRPGKKYSVHADQHDDPSYPRLENRAVVVVERGASAECAVRILVGKEPAAGDPLFNDGYVSALLPGNIVYAVDADAATLPYAYPAVAMSSAADPEIDIWELLKDTVFRRPELTPVSRDVCRLRVTIAYDPPVRTDGATAIRGVATIAPASSAAGCSRGSQTLPYTLRVRAGNATLPLDYYRDEVAHTLVFELVKRFMAGGP
jgi:hypothetical protein